MERGWVKVWRKLEDNPYMSRPYFAALWLHLLLLATHKEIDAVFGTERIRLKPGELITGRNSLAKRTGIKPSTLEDILKTLEKQQQIRQQASTKNRLISILNWTQYQEDRQQSRQQADSKPTHTRTKEQKKVQEVTTNNIASPTAPQEDLRKIVNKYFDLQSYEDADRKASFPRHVRDAKQLLQACQGDSSKACAVLDALHAWGAKKKLSYTIGTALKRWKDFSGTAPQGETWEERMARVNAEVEKYKLEHGI